MELGWIDFSKTDRDKVLDVLDLLGEKGTLDELGIAPIRDAYSKLFFPGTSTLQNRAKYFFIIPFIFKDLELNNHTDNEELADDFEKIEIKCATELIKNNPGAKGIVGKSAIDKGHWVKRAPSSIYWAGLQKYGIIKFNDSEGASIDDLIEIISSKKINMDDYKGLGSKKDSAQDNFENNISYDFNIIYDKNWKNNLDINLTPQEGELLKEHIITSCEDSLFSYLLKDEKVDLDEVVKCKEFADLKKVIDIPKQFLNDYENALAFSDFMEVLIVIYNGLVLDLHKDYAEEFLNTHDLKELSKINIDDLKVLHNLEDNKLKDFLIESQQLMANNNVNGLKECIINREIYLKGNKAKSYHSSDLKKDNWFGRKLDYRFSNAVSIIKDICNSENNLSEVNKDVKS